MHSKHYLYGILVMSLLLTASGGAQGDEESPLTLEGRARRTLVSIGSCQLAFQSRNNERLFPAFDELQEDLYIAEGYGYFNMVEGYEIRHFMEPDKTGFTVIVIPTIDSDPPLGMYTIDETMIIQKLEPSSGPGNSIPDPPGEVRTRTDESAQLDAPESVTVYFVALNNWTHNIYAEYIYIESMDQWYKAGSTYF